MEAGSVMKKVKPLPYNTALEKVFLVRWLWTGILLIVLMVMVGGITRLTGSGLSIVEWKPVTGIVPPLTEQSWQIEFDKYKQYPEYQKLNYGITLQQFKKIFFWEYMHRLLGRLIGLVFLVPFIIFYVKGWLNKRLVKWLAAVFLLGVCQAVMGWYMVKSGLDKLPYVSHLRLAAHQGLTLVLIGLLYWLTLTYQQPNIKNTDHSTKPRVVFRILTLILFCLLCMQITFGAFVAGLKAGYSYTNFPWMGDSFFPATEQLQTAPFFYNGVAVQFVHRWLGFLVALGVLLLYYLARKHDLRNSKLTTMWVLVSVWLQVTLGVITLMSKVPLALGVIHQGMAFVLFLLFIKLIHIQFPARAANK